MSVAFWGGVEEKARVGVVRDGLTNEGRNVALAVGTGARRIDGINRCRSIGIAMIVVVVVELYGDTHNLGPSSAIRAAAVRTEALDMI